MSTIILHHYDISPFAEKIRLALGHKSLGWKSVLQPMVLPKPEFVALTGGYRRIPVMQIGADVYCDTNRIAEELEARCPEPTLYPDGRLAQTEVWCMWAERVLMWPTARYVTAVNDDQLGAAFHADRAAMRGHAAPSTEDLERSIPLQRAQCVQLLAVLESVLDDGRPFLLGQAPGLADFAVYQRIWWLNSFGRRAADVLEPFGRICSWAERVGGVGAGNRSELGREQALEVARDSEPEPAPAVRARGEASTYVGRQMSIGTEAFAPDPVVGTVASISSNSVSLIREDPNLGRLAVHFPLFGYDLKPAT